MIDHALLDRYEDVEGDFLMLPWGHGIDRDLWDIIDGLMLDLHLIRHGYATEGYERHIERLLVEVCADASVIERVKALRL